MTLEEIQSALTEMQTRVDHPLMQMQPFAVELSYPIARQSNSKKCGVTSKVTFDVDDDLYTHFQHGLPQGVILRGVLWVDVETAAVHEQEQKTKPEKMYGKFWQLLIQSGFMTHPDMLELLHQLRAVRNLVPDYDGDALIRDCFGGSRAEKAGPAQLRGWMDQMRIPRESALFVLIAQAERETAQRKAAQ